MSADRTRNHGQPRRSAQDILLFRKRHPDRILLAEHEMARRRSHPLLAWLLLVWFGLANTVFAGGLVLCNDGHGGSRVEWGGCERNTDGECLISCGGESNVDPGDSHPCQDTPIQGQEQITKAPSRQVGGVISLVPVLSALLDQWEHPPVAMPVVRTTSEPQRPPDALKRIRTVVLLV